MSNVEAIGGPYVLYLVFGEGPEGGAFLQRTFLHSSDAWQYVDRVERLGGITNESLGIPIRNFRVVSHVLQHATEYVRKMTVSKKVDR